MAKVKTSINLDEEVYEYILQLAKDESRSVSQQINKVFLDLMKKEGEK
jgi:hypothetical protein